MKIFALGASLRKESLNQTLLTLAVEIAKAEGVEVDIANLREFPLPIYDGDVETTSGVPAEAKALAERISAAEGLMIASPEYNFSIPGGLKNAIDWVSRLRPQPFAGRFGFLLSASPSLVGGNRALWALRQPLEALGMTIKGDMFSLASAHNALTPEGTIRDENLAQRLEGSVKSYVATLKKIAS